MGTRAVRTVPRGQGRFSFAKPEVREAGRRRRVVRRKRLSPAQQDRLNENAFRLANEARKSVGSLRGRLPLDEYQELMDSLDKFVGRYAQGKRIRVAEAQSAIGAATTILDARGIKWSLTYT